jgi:hypothetical protein
MNELLHDTCVCRVGETRAVQHKGDLRYRREALGLAGSEMARGWKEIAR